MTIFTRAVEPGGETHYVRCLQTISSLMGPVVALGQSHHVIFLTSGDWAKVADEIVRKYSSSLTDPTKTPTPENFKEAIVGNVLFCNSGTEDEELVKALNRKSYEDSGFANRRDNLARRRSRYDA